MSFFSSATEKRKRDSDDTDELQPGPSTPKKTSSDIYNDTTSISCERSVCDPLKLKMTPKVNYLGVTMTPKNFFEGKTLLLNKRLALFSQSILAELFSSNNNPFLEMQYF